MAPSTQQQFKIDLYVEAGLSNQYFQKVKTAVSYFQPFKNDWQIEIGTRYAQLNNKTNFYTGILGLEKTNSNMWWNIKTFLMKDPNESYYNIMGQMRLFMSNKINYVTVMAAVGNAPKD